MSSNAEGVKMVRITAAELESLCPQVMLIPLQVTLIPPLVMLIPLQVTLIQSLKRSTFPLER